jgi:hypothetical protein
MPLIKVIKYYFEFREADLASGIRVSVCEESASFGYCG